MEINQEIFEIEDLIIPSINMHKPCKIKIVINKKKCIFIYRSQGYSMG